MAALAVVIMLTAYFPYLTYAIPAVAGIFVMIPAIECGKKWGYMTYLVAAAISLVACEMEAKLLFVGDGELYPQIRSKIQELGLDDCVIMTGERSDVPELLRAMDVFVLTSFSEGLSVSAVEAQASGLPCVLPDTVSKLTDVTGNVRFLNLDLPAAEWAEQILEKSAIGAACVKEKLVAAGYDLSHAAEMLYQRFMGIAE